LKNTRATEVDSLGQIAYGCSNSSNELKFWPWNRSTYCYRSVCM